MGILRNIGRAVAAIALTAAMAGSAALKQAAGFAPTPRKPDRPKRRSYASPRRERGRSVARKRFDKQMQKEREIGVDPIFMNRRSEHVGERSAWLKKSREWDFLHG